MAPPSTASRPLSPSFHTLSSTRSRGSRAGLSSTSWLRSTCSLVRKLFLRSYCSLSQMSIYFKLNSTESRNLVIIMIILHFSVWLGLAIVCEDYFVPSLNRVSDGKWFSNPRLFKIFALIIDFTSCFSSGSLPGCGGRHLHGSRELRSWARYLGHRGIRCQGKCE